MDREKEKELEDSKTEISPDLNVIDGTGTARKIRFSKTFTALKHRNYRLFFIGQTISLTGTWMQNVAQSWLIYDLTSSPLYLGIVGFSFSLPTLVLSLTAGVVIDRVSKRNLLVVTQILSMILALMLAADVFLGFVKPWHIVFLSFFLGAVTSFDAPARQAFVVEMVEKEDLTNAIALNAVIFNTGRVIGPALAGIVLAMVGAGSCFLINGISYIAVLFGLIMMKVKPFTRAVHSDSPLRQLKEGLSYIWNDKAILTLMTLVGVSNLFGFGYVTLLPAFAEDILNKGPTGLGLLSAASGIGALTGALMMASLGNYRKKGMLITVGSLFYPVMTIIFAFSRIFALSIFSLVAVGLGFMIQNATTNALIQTIVPDELRGRVMSVYTLIFLGFFPLGSLMAGTIGEHLGVQAGAGFGGVVSLFFGLLFLWRAPYLRRIP